MYSTYITQEEVNLDIFTGDGVISANTTGYREYVWTRPDNCTSFYFFVMSSGAPGGKGASGAAGTTRYGGQGGMASQIYTGFFPYFFVPPVLYIKVTGQTNWPTTSVKTGLYFDPGYTFPFIEVIGGNTATTAGQTLFPANTDNFSAMLAGYANGSMYSSATLYSNTVTQAMGVVGIAPNGWTGNTLHYSCVGPGAGARVIITQDYDGSNTYMSSNLSAFVPPNPVGGTVSNPNGENGWTIFKPTFISIGGASGASLNSGTGGNGGNGGYGSGGGGSGAGVTAGTPGQGGPGMIIIKGV